MPPSAGGAAAAQSYLWLIIALPLAGAVVNGAIGRKLGRANAALVAIGVMVAAFVISCIGFYWVADGQTLHLRGGTWFRVPGEGGRAVVDVSWGLLMDRLSGTLSLVVTGVGSLIHVYSSSYMSHEDDFGYARFFTYLNLFVAAMMTLVLGDSLVLTFVGWEGVGLCSYLLIGFWYTDAQKAYCGRKAFVVNRIGDFGFLLGLFTLLALFGTAEYGQMAAMAKGVDPGAAMATGVFAGKTAGWALAFAALMLFLACTGKSAQLPLYVWLPDAMAGPTPVSALIHAATMVTAGVYLVARTSFLFALVPGVMAVVMLVGAATAVVAAAIAFAQNDIKKVLAYSTVSQLGFMFIGVGAGAFFAGVLHLVTHAFFKACLFLGAGSVMHGMHEDTDIRNMGGLWRKMPHTAWTFLIATIAITGVLPLSGFFSKDAILAGALFSHNAAVPWAGKLAYALGTLAAAGTAFYMTRLFALTFAGKPRTEAAAHAHESSPLMYVPLWVLAGLSVVALVLGLPKVAAFGHWGEVFGEFTEPVFAQAYERLGVEPHVALWPFLVAAAIAIGCAALAWAMYAGAWRGTPEKVVQAAPGLYRFTLDKFRVDELYDLFVVKPIRGVAWTLWRVVDSFIIDGLLVNGSARLAAGLGKAFRVVQNGDAQRYAAVMALAAAGILFWVWVGVGGTR
ncbi:MAG TPA: NADH-quinone oxidoreductase subunit L [Anaeromyxobacteraceae bacterium]|nr:NADH-quinone oxidoreductase subunit L [Anaeromyxobacteraceae bacterium]